MRTLRASSAARPIHVMAAAGHYKLASEVCIVTERVLYASHSCLILCNHRNKSSLSVHTRTSI